MARLDDNYCRYPRPILWLLRAGTVEIGGGDDDARPTFEASVDSFYLSKRPVTNEQFEAFDPDHRRAEISAGDDDPATGVSFAQARGYCDWYARVSRKPMRLPTEIEWEYACRAGRPGDAFYGGPAAAEAYVQDARNTAGRLDDYRTKKPNPAGLLGMLGGVWEWTASPYRAYPLAPADGRDAPGSGGERVLRGGSFRCDRAELAAWRRRPADPALVADDVGFRLARSL